MENECKQQMKAFNDALNVVNGKWKVIIIGSLESGKKRYLELQRMVEGIGTKMLSKELQELELNGLITRSVVQTRPITVEYELTEHGRSIKHVVEEMALWGQQHRDKVINGKL